MDKFEKWSQWSRVYDLLNRKYSDEKIFSTKIINWLQTLNGQDFRDYVAEVFTRLDYSVILTDDPDYQEVDIIAEKNEIKYYIQCRKYFKAKEVDKEVVQNFYKSLAHRLIYGKAYFIITNKFTGQAYEFTKDKPIELVDGKRFFEYISFLRSRDKNYDRKYFCPECREKLVNRKEGGSHSLVCSSYPKCRYRRTVD